MVFHTPIKRNPPFCRNLLPGASSTEFLPIGWPVSADITSTFRVFSLVCIKIPSGLPVLCWNIFSWCFAFFAVAPTSVYSLALLLVKLPVTTRYVIILQVASLISDIITSMISNLSWSALSGFLSLRVTALSMISLARFPTWNWSFIFEGPAYFWNNTFSGTIPAPDY